MPVKVFKTLNLNNVPLLVAVTKSDLVAVILNNATRDVAWIKIWDADALSKVKIGTTVPYLTFCSTPSIGATGVQSNDSYDLHDVECKDGIIIAATKGWQDSNVEPIASDGLVLNLLWR